MLISLSLVPLVCLLSSLHLTVDRLSLSLYRTGINLHLNHLWVPTRIRICELLIYSRDNHHHSRRRKVGLYARTWTGQTLLMLRIMEEGRCLESLLLSRWEATYSSSWWRTATNLVSKYWDVIGYDSSLSDCLWRLKGSSKANSFLTCSITRLYCLWTLLHELELTMSKSGTKILLSLWHQSLNEHNSLVRWIVIAILLSFGVIGD